MKNRYAVLITLLVIFLPVAAVVASNYHLLTHRPDIKIIERPEMKMLAIEHIGGYQKASTFIVDIYQMAGEEKITCLELIGQYFDTMLVEESKRRSRYGCVVKEFPEKTPEGYKQVTIPAQSYAFTTRDEQGILVTFMYATRLAQFAQQNGYAPSGYFIEMYTPTRLKRGHAEMMQAIFKPDIDAPAIVGQ